MTKKKNDIQHKIEFSIQHIKKLQFIETDPSLLGIEKKSFPEAKIDMGFGLIPNDKLEMVSIQMNADFYIIENEQKIVLFGIRTEYAFKIKDFTNVFQMAKDGKVTIPDVFMHIFLNVTIAGTRGMIAALITVEKYRHLILPPLDMGRILTEMKNPQKVPQEQPI